MNKMQACGFGLITIALLCSNLQPADYDIGVIVGIIVGLIGGAGVVMLIWYATDV